MAVQMKRRNKKGQGAPRTLDQFKPLIQKLARKAVSRATSANIFLEFEDMEQELSEQFLQAIESYDPNAGRSFMNFFISGAHWRINRIINNLVRHNVANDTFSGDSGHVVDGDEMRFWDILDSGTPTPEQNHDGEQVMVEIRDRLDGRSRKVFELLIDPPKILLSEFDLCRKGSTRKVRMPTQYGFTFLMKVLQIRPGESSSIRREISSVINDVLGYNHAR